MEQEGQIRSGSLLGFAVKLSDEASGAVIDAYDLGSTAVSKTYSTLKKVPLLIKEIKCTRGIMEVEGQKRSGVLGFVVKVSDEACDAVVDAYDLGSTALNKTSSTLKKMPVLTGKAKGIITGSLEAIKSRKSKKEAAAAREYEIKGKEEKKPKKETKVKIKESKTEVVRETAQRELVSTSPITTEPEIISPTLKVRYSEEELKRMVKPQLISLCKNLNIECDYKDTKDQTIERILGH